MSFIAVSIVQVTDYAEEKEILSTGNELEDAIVAIRNKQAQKTAEKMARERELAKVMLIILLLKANIFFQNCYQYR